MPPLALEQFDAPAHAEDELTRLTEAELDALRREAYENGFQAGAADAIATVQADDARLSADLVATLQDLSFGFHEASAHVAGNMTPMLRSIVDVVLPACLAETVGHTLLEAAEPLIAEAAGIPVRVLVSPAEADAVRRILGEAADVPFVIVEDPALERGRAHLKLGRSERHIDVADVLARISTAIDAVTDLNTRKIANV